MPHVKFSNSVNASLETVWNLLLDKIENPKRYIAAIEESKILDRADDGVLREMRTPKMIVKERITVDEQAREIRFTLVDHPLFTGQTINRVVPPSNDRPDDPLTLTFTLDWEPSNQEAQKITQAEVAQTIQHALLDTKRLAEQQDAQKNTISKQEKPIPERSSGEMFGIVKRMFAAAESNNVDEYTSFFTKNAMFKVGNLPPVFGAQGIRDFEAPVRQVVKSMSHDIKAVWEQGDVVICEMEIAYTRRDGKVLTLPCINVIQIEGGKVQKLQAYLDPSPVFA